MGALWFQALGFRCFRGPEPAGLWRISADEGLRDLRLGEPWGFGVESLRASGGLDFAGRKTLNVLIGTALYQLWAQIGGVVFCCLGFGFWA